MAGDREGARKIVDGIQDESLKNLVRMDVEDFPVNQPTNQPTVAVDNQSTVAVYNDSWDGSVRQVKQWLNDNLKDPDSFKPIEWSPVLKTPSGHYTVRCKYRAKNSYGGYDIFNQLFYMDSQGNVIQYVDVNE